MFVIKELTRQLYSLIFSQPVFSNKVQKKIKGSSVKEL